MGIKRYIILTFAAVLLVGCSKDIISDSASSDAVELTGINASVESGINTRTGNVVYLQDRISRYQFVSGDKMVFTKIERSESPITRFQYKDVAFNSNASGAWERDKETGSSVASPGVHPERVYWSDASSAHTFVGYSLPKDNNGFDWKKSSYTYTKDGQQENFETYYGAIGDPLNKDEVIDYNPASATTETITTTVDGKEKEITFGYSQKMRDEDLLLTFDNNLKADNSVANIKFYHALSSVRIIVNISGFYGTATDAYSRVSDMILHNQPTLYRWKQQSVAVDALLAESENAALQQNNLWGSTNTPQYNQRKNIKLWNTKPEGDGQGASKLFTFYGITVPQDADYFSVFTGDAYKDLEISFKVTYPDPLKNDPVNKTIIKDYTAKIDNPVKFYPGKCTTINITLNHKDETMTVGASYQDWDYIDTPDEGVLKKNSTFVDNVSRSSVYLFGDASATVDDATWLYIDQSDHKLRDVYGHVGSETDPFVISTAQQFVAFAHEVLGTNRVACSYKDHGGTEHTLAAGAGFDFTGYHVKLDANMTMQPNTNLKHDSGGFYTEDSEGKHYTTTAGVTWPGIGDANHRFNGYFNGGFRHINQLYGRPLFTHIGPEGIIDHIFITDALGITGSGSIAETNDGIICGSHVEGDIVGADYSEFCGSIVGINNGVLIACSHIGSITGNATILGALLGKNNGIMVTCYNVGDAKNNKKDSEGKSCPAYAGVGDFAAPKSVAYCCYFNKDFYTAQDYPDLQSKIGHVAFPLSTSEMQSKKYVDQAALDNPTDDNTGEITDVSKKTDMFYWHWSLNTGLNRAIAYLTGKLAGTPDTSTNDIEFHAPGTNDDDSDVERVALKKTQVEWLVNHFAKVTTVGGETKLEFTHQFQFIPGTYPKLK